MIVVLDASAAIEVVLQRPASSEINAAITEADVIFVPDLFVAEVSNALWKYVVAGGANGSALLEDAVSLPDEVISSTELYREAFGLATQSGHPVYDCLYAILARRNNATLLTVDRRLTTLVRSHEISVIPRQP